MMGNHTVTLTRASNDEAAGSIGDLDVPIPGSGTLTIQSGTIVAGAGLGDRLPLPSSAAAR